MVTGWVTHSLTCGVRPRPSLPTTSTEPLESEGRGDGEPQRFCPSNRAPTTGRLQEARSRGAERPHIRHFSCFRLPPATNKKDRSQAVLICGTGEERNRRRPFSQRARRRAEERNTLYFSPASLASDSIQPTKKETPKGLFRLWSWRRKELPVAVPPASEAKSRGAEHSLLLPSSHASDSLLPHKKRPPNSGLSLWSWRESNPRPNK